MLTLVFETGGFRLSYAMTFHATRLDNIAELCRRMNGEARGRCREAGGAQAFKDKSDSTVEFEYGLARGIALLSAGPLGCQERRLPCCFHFQR